MIRVERTQSNHPDFIRLVSKLDRYLAVLDGNEHSFYQQFNSVENLKHAVVAYNADEIVGCGAFKVMDAETVEIKRMFVDKKARGRQVATTVLNALELWAKEEKFTNCLLETGKRMPDAIALYLKNKYFLVSNYGPYIGIENSVCFKKVL